MQLTTWNPLREIDELFGRYGRGLRANLPEEEWLPPVDINEADNEYVLRAELPGVEKKDVNISVENHVLTIEGERRNEHAEKGEKSHRIERYFGRFVRSFNLPEDVNESEIKAEHNDGVLQVHLPKSETEKRQRIEVGVE